MAGEEASPCPAPDHAPAALPPGGHNAARALPCVSDLPHPCWATPRCRAGQHSWLSDETYRASSLPRVHPHAACDFLSQKNRLSQAERGRMEPTCLYTRTRSYFGEISGRREFSSLCPNCCPSPQDDAGSQPAAPHSSVPCLALPLEKESLDYSTDSFGGK